MDEIKKELLQALHDVEKLVNDAKKNIERLTHVVDGDEKLQLDLNKKIKQDASTNLHNITISNLYDTIVTSQIDKVVEAVKDDDEYNTCYEYLVDILLLNFGSTLEKVDDGKTYIEKLKQLFIDKKKRFSQEFEDEKKTLSKKVRSSSMEDIKKKFNSENFDKKALCKCIASCIEFYLEVEVSDPKIIFIGRKGQRFDTSEQSLTDQYIKVKQVKYPGIKCNAMVLVKAGVVVSIKQ
jgi:hypothetical protein